MDLRVGFSGAWVCMCIWGYLVAMCDLIWGFLKDCKFKIVTWPEMC